MNSPSYQSRRQLETLDRGNLESLQLTKLNGLLNEILPDNQFYQKKLNGLRSLDSLRDLSDLPLTTKAELIGDASDSTIATNTTYPLERYVRFHRTSGTQGRPLVVLDTAEDWQWWIDSWQFVLDAAEINECDRVLMAFSFGPFIGFWSANDAAIARGALVVPTGGMSSIARLQLIQSTDATALFCTPSYALHLAEVAGMQNINLGKSSVRVIVVAGEPGGSIPTLRQQIEDAWQAKVIDHVGASEIGPWGFADRRQSGILVNESEFIAEFIDPQSGQPVPMGRDEPCELVLTTLGRAGSPVIRYQTGDLVRPKFDNQSESGFVLLDGGVLGRRDDMMIIRGVNIFPSSIEQILRGFPRIAEYRMTAFKRGAMDQLSIEIEDPKDQPEQIAEALKVNLGLNVDVASVALGSLPRFEAKGKRFVDQRNEPS